MYGCGVPRLWKQTVAAHREEVREAIMDATWSLVSDHGPFAVTMSQIAQEAGIGRATLYKYFPDVETILIAWHDRHVSQHLHRLAELSEQAGDPWERLQAVMHAYAGICYYRARHGAEDLEAFLHRDAHVAQARQRLHEIFEDLLFHAAESGCLRTDVGPPELANYCLHALAAAGSLTSEGAVDRLVVVTLAALRDPG